MKILYNASDGEIYHAVRDSDYFYFSHSTNVALAEVSIDELAPVNQALCRDLLHNVGRIDGTGKGKYYVDTATGDLMERTGWQELIPGVV